MLRAYRRLPHHLFVVAVALAPRLAAAQAAPTPLPRVTQEVVVTASMAPVPADDLSRTVTVLTRDELDRMGVTSIVDALRYVPGVDARARGPLDVQTDFSIRGSTFGQSLILADGVRLNDSQTGHHDGEIPLPEVALDRIEVVSGAASSVYGTDALGGTVNVISRQGVYQAATIEAGQHGYVDAQGAMGGGVLPTGWTASGWGSRSDGFEFDREFAMGGGTLRGSPARGLVVDVRHQRRAFGANGFYGASPSKEWTDQTVTAATWQRAHGAWTTTVTSAYRNHGDHFRWDIAQPGFAENRHRTNAADAQVNIERQVGTSTVTFGAAGGGDWVRSTNLGNHQYASGSAFAEWQARAGDRATIIAGLRVDDYSSFGHAANPSVSIVTRAPRGVRLRASAAHAFRIPTFTELYYSDPADLGNPNLRPEHGWSVDGGADWAMRGWTASASVFGRWDSDVIDWLRATPADIWRSANVRDVTTHGVELSATRHVRGTLVRGYYTGMSVGAPTIDLLSKYVLEYARHQAGASISVPLPGRVQAAINLDLRDRLVAQAWQTYALASAKLSRSFGRTDVFISGTNLANVHYQEIAGVDMPGRWVMVGLTVR